jgi:predicted dehydrogenase
MKKIRWGILGCGRIAGKFASDLRLIDNATLEAVTAREHQAAQQFASEWNVGTFHGSYEELVKNPAVDVIYIATPHSHHYEHMKLCLENGKAVLCEKAFTINARQAKEIIDLARTKNIFLMEAFWTRFLPHYQKMKIMLHESSVGTIQYLYAEFGFKPTPPIPPRLYDPQLGGGSLLDIGVYPVFIVLDILGRPDDIAASIILANTGVDEQCAVRFEYRNGAIAHVFSTFCTNLASGADIAGTNGRIRLTHRFHSPESGLEYYPGIVKSRQAIETEQARGFGYEYEAQHVTDCLLRGLTESPIRTHADTLLLMETLDRIREKAGIFYESDSQ